MQGDLREALLLQVANHRIAAEAPVRDPHFHIVEAALVQGKLEEVLRAVQALLLDGVLPIDVVHVLLVHTHDVHRALERVDDAAVAVGQAVLHVAQRGVDEHAVLVPGATLDADVLMEAVQVLKVLACHQHVVLRHEGHIGAVLRPHSVAHAAWHRHLVDGLARREVVHHDLLLALQQDAVVAAREDVVRGHWWLELLGKLILQVVDADGPAVLQDGEAAPGREAHCPGTALLRRDARVTGHPAGAHEEIVAAVVLGVENENVDLGSVEGVVLQRLHARDHRVRRAPAGRHLRAVEILIQIDDFHLAVLH
mmetsp:Transcript_42595/g.110036  ORF Transcript_42595/g.110036 Transcript_42595/m.110036 type:complete len:310 (+) Transcript_42595:2070-2999(+)